MLLKEMEPYFIKKYDSFGKNGYNMTLGGEGTIGFKHSEKTKELLRIANTGRKWTDEQKKSLEKRIPWNKYIGRKTRILLGRKFGDNHPQAKIRKTYEYTFDDGRVEIFNGLNKFCKIRGYYPNSIRDVLFGKCKKHKDIVKVREI